MPQETPSGGIGFGEEGEGYLRIALVENEHRIRQALRQMKRAMKELEPEIGSLLSGA